jgi:hypothetical protein
MTHRYLTGAAALVAVASLASCGLPPITTAEQSITIKYDTFIPKGVPIITGFPAFADQKAPASTIPLPGEARSIKLNSVILNLKMRNSGPIPLRIKLFLSKSSVDPYSTPALGGDQAQIDLPARAAEGQDTSKNFPIDPALLQEPELKLGYTFGSPGTSEPVTFQDSDAVYVRHSVTVQPKLF